MKAIIVQDSDCRALLDQLKLESFNLGGVHSRSVVEQLTEAQVKGILSDVHGRFHYIVTRWLQEQGAQIIR